MTPRTAEIIAVGSELLGSTRADTNSLFLSGRLAELGIDLRDQDRRRRRARRSRDAAAPGARAHRPRRPDGRARADRRRPDARRGRRTCWGCRWTIDEAIVAKIRARFERRGLVMPEVNRRQAQVPRGAVVLDNPERHRAGPVHRPAAARSRRIVILLPGPPRELQPMFDLVCSGPLRERAGARARLPDDALHHRARRVARRAGGPADLRALARRLAADLDDDPGRDGADRAAPDGARRPTRRARCAILERARAELLAVIGGDVYSTDGRVMEEVVGDLLEGARLHDRGRGILHRRAADVAPDRRPRQLRLRARRRRRLCVRGQDGAARRAGGR